MIVLTYPAENYEVFLQIMSSSLGEPLQGNKLVFNGFFGKGYMELVNLPMDIQAIVSDYEIADDVHFIRQKSTNGFYNLRIEVIQDTTPVELLIDGEVIDNTSPKGYAYLNNSFCSLAYKAKKGVKVKSLNLRFSKKVIENITGFTDEDEQLLNAITTNLHKERIVPASIEMLGILNEVIALDANDPNRKMTLLNRSLYFSELFFKAVSAQGLSQGKYKPAVTKTDFERIQQVEKMITDCLDRQPPKQEALATNAHMSVSKLKYTFKAIHGTSIYNYFRKARMEKSLELLQDGKSVSETAYELGYSDISNFIRNFKKQFNLSPGSIKHFHHN